MSVNIKTATGLQTIAGNAKAYANATQMNSGLMSPQDKIKLDGIGEASLRWDLIFHASNTIGEEIPLSKFLGYDLIYIEFGPNKMASDISFTKTPRYCRFLPGDMFREFSATLDEITARIFEDATANVWFEFQNYFNNPHIQLAQSYANDHIYIYGLKQVNTATKSGGSRVLAYVTNDLAEKTVIIRGASATTPLTIYGYFEYVSPSTGKVTSENAGMWNVYVTDSVFKNISASSPGTTYCSYAVSSTEKGFRITKKANVRMRLWIDGEGWNIVE